MQAASCVRTSLWTAPPSLLQQHTCDNTLVAFPYAWRQCPPAHIAHALHHLIGARNARMLRSNTSEYLDASVDDICADMQRNVAQLVAELKAITRDLPASGADDPNSESPAGEPPRPFRGL
jgi:hypothetical protein